MPLCGFDNQMLDGLEAFYTGLKEAAVRNAKERDQSIIDAIHQEIREMDEFLGELSALPDPEDRQCLEGVTQFARSFYQNSLRRGGNVYSAMDAEIAHRRKFLQSVDERYYGHIQGKSPKPMKDLVAWIAQEYG